jgi:hypothetical protein
MHTICTPYAIPVKPGQFHKKNGSQNCPKRLKIFYFCPKSPLFELFELFDLKIYQIMINYKTEKKFKKNSEIFREIVQRLCYSVLSHCSNVYYFLTLFAP